jgi:hypothetical protein
MAAKFDAYLTRAIDSFAVSGGHAEGVLLSAPFINPRGSFVGRSNEEGTRALTGAERMLALVGLPYTLRFSEPPPAAPTLVAGAAACWTAPRLGALQLADYGGLGVCPRTGHFRLALLRRHCALEPAAIHNALVCALGDRCRALFCQALRCSRALGPDDYAECRVCGHCLMGVYCGACQPGELDLCCVCLLSAQVARLPSRWLFDRGSRVNEILANGGMADGDENRSCVVTLAELVAPQIMVSLLTRPAT